MNSKDHLFYHKQHNSLAGKIGGKVSKQRRKEQGIDQFYLTKEQRSALGNIARWHNENCKQVQNHKIKKIEYLNQKINTGTLTIDQEEKYHNYHTFALDAGIYTKNSQTGEIRDDRRFMTMLEDYWLPQREGRGTKVDTLKGGENLGKMEDVEYFQKKLFDSLNVPVARLQPEHTIVNIGGPDQLSREELKFSKFCDRLKQRFAAIFTELLEKQLVLKRLQWML